MPSQGRRRRVVVSARMGLTAPREVPGTSTQLPEPEESRGKLEALPESEGEVLEEFEMMEVLPSSSRSWSRQSLYELAKPLRVLVPETGTRS